MAERSELKVKDRSDAQLQRAREATLRLRVIFLDDSERVFDVEQKILGCDFFGKVCEHLKLVEKEYFGLEFRHQNGNYVWLELLKPLAKQIKYTSELPFRFIVKFFPPDPGLLQKSLTSFCWCYQKNGCSRIFVVQEGLLQRCYRPLEKQEQGSMIRATWQWLDIMRLIKKFIIVPIISHPLPAAKEIVWAPCTVEDATLFPRSSLYICLPTCPAYLPY